MSHIKWIKGYISGNATTDTRALLARREYGTDGNTHVNRKNLRLFPCCCNQLDATIQADIRQAKITKTTHEERYLRTLHLRNRFPAVTSSATRGLGQIVARRPRVHRIRTYRPHRGRLLTAPANVFSAEDENQRRLAAFRRSSHLV